ncbi:hypothetical protein ACLHDG_09280 [Sulfurovum sp. CS9]|uniref:hypothetical protein n=1 Tax=Sulfurovum sp. CS9 TaxID=3391146 RepID=UPI0039EB717A
MKKILIAVALFTILIFLLINQNFEDMQISKYESLEEVKNNKAIQGGWIPAILPASAYDIVESHDLDTNTIFGSFKYKEKDEETFIQNLTDLNSADDMLEWGNFIFKVDKNLNQVKFRNRPTLTQ